MLSTTKRCAALALLLLLPAASQAQHDEDIAIAVSGGALVALGDLATPVRVQQGFCAGGLCLYSATDPGFVTPGSPGSPYSAVAAGTALRVEIVAIEAGASLKVGSTVLDAAGKSASLGTAPSVHVHPSWQLTAAAGANVQRTITLRVTAPNGPYSASPPYSIVLSTFDVPPSTSTSTTSTTTTSTTEEPTTSTTLEPHCGDALLQGEDGEDCDHGPANGERGGSCSLDCTWAACGDADHSGTITAADALYTLRTAVGSVSCAACVCDARVSADIVFSAADALILLRYAVGVAVQLQCPPCA